MPGNNSLRRGGSVSWRDTADDEGDEFIFDMEDDGAGDAGDDVIQGETQQTRCKQCNCHFALSADHKLLARRRRGRKNARAICDACLESEGSESDGVYDDLDVIHDSTAAGALNRSSERASEFPRVQGAELELDNDTILAILVRLVAASGTAEQLSCCSCVCRAWYATAITDDLWKAILHKKWGEAARQATEVARYQQGSKEPAVPFRAQYIRSVSTQVLTWGQTARSEDLAASTPRSPVLLEPFGLRGFGIKQISAGANFSCAVSTILLVQLQVGTFRARAWQPQ